MKSHRDQTFTRPTAPEEKVPSNPLNPGGTSFSAHAVASAAQGERPKTVPDSEAEAVEPPVASAAAPAVVETIQKADEASSKAHRTAILVLGMHRSGTSALTRVISLLGADLPKDLMPAVVGNNEAGFWESMDVWRLNDEILASGGSTWSDCRRFDPDWIRTPEASSFKVRAVRILEKDFSRSSIFVLKDPRICRLLPFWLEVLLEFDCDTRCALTLRNPLEVAASLNARDGFSPARSHTLWLRHLLDAEYQSRGLKRTIIRYDALLDDWREEARAIADELGVDVSSRSTEVERKVDQFLKNRYRSHAVDDESLFQDPDVAPWVKEAFEALKTLRAEPESKSALDRLNAVRTNFDQISDSLDTVFQAEELARDELKEAVATHSAHASSLEQMASQREQMASQREARIQELERTLTAKEKNARVLEQEVTQRNGRIRDLEAMLRAEQEQRHAATRLNKELLERLDSIQTAATWQLASPLRASESHWPRLVHTIAAVPKFAWWTLTMRLPQRLRMGRFAAEILENELFDRSWYIEKNPDVVLNGVNPLLHWLVTGWTEGRDPNPYFDTNWYLTRYSDAAKTGQNPLAHYLAQGADAGLDPSPLFDTKWYLAQNQDVAKAGTNPLEHYIRSGRKEGRKPRPDSDKKALQTDVLGTSIAENKDLVQPDTIKDDVQDYAILRQDVATSGFWDENWYLSNYYNEYRESEYSSASEPKRSALDFYLQEGWRRGHKPSETFVCGSASNHRINPVSYFLNHLRFEGYHFDRNVWIPSRSRLAAYLEAKNERHASRVVYTCILNKYDVLMQPYFINDDWDYICFTDDESAVSNANDGVWTIRKANCKISDPNRNNRWHKIHPHILFPEYEESIYIDGNINVISSCLFDEIDRRDNDLLFTQHFCRNCVYEEIEELLRSPRTSEENKALLIKQEEFLEKENFPRSYGLGENNIIHRRHNTQRVVQAMDRWWEMLSQYSSRDQAGLAYVMWKQERSMQEHMFVNSRIGYKDFWVVRHQKKIPELQTLTPAFDENNIAVVFSTNDSFALYLGVAIKSLIENTSDENNYDIIILESDLKEESKQKLKALSSGRRNVSLRFLNVKKHLSLLLPKYLLHVEGYVPPETYNKCMLTNLLAGYERCVYLDSDIVVLDDIAKLHDIRLDGKSIGASLNVANINASFSGKVIKNQNFRQYVEEQLGVFDYRKYFQAGVLVLNLTKLYNMELLELCISKLERIRKPVFFDQCIFNSVFYGDVAFFSTAWNHVWYMQKYSYLKSSVPEDVFFDYAHGRIDPKIVHYASKDKPQNKPEWSLAHHFWKYAKMTSFFQEILNDCASKLTDSDYALLMSKIEEEEQEPRVLVHLHLFYHDQLDHMLRKLQNVNGCVFDIFVTIADDDVSVRDRILKQFGDATILVLRNVGYDIYPFLTVLSKVRLEDYDYILKIHTKNRRSEGQDEVYSIKVPDFQWRNELIDALLGDKEIFKRNLSLLQENRAIGSVGAKRFIFDVRKHNEETVYNLSGWKSKINITRGSFYVGGSMFLARSYPFEKLKSMNLKAEDFGSDGLKTKDYKNLAHVVERLSGIVINNEGFDILGV